MSVIQVLQFALDGSSAEQSAVAGNLANAETPGYRAQDVSFEQSLQNALANGGTASVSESPSAAPAGTDGNNVSIATELVEGEQSALEFQALTHSLNAQFRLISGATGGRFT